MKKFLLPCVIFAGGKSSRMGEDKALKHFGSTTLAQYQYDRLSKLFSTVYISTKVDKFPFQAKLIIDSSEVYAPTPAFLDIFNHCDTFFAISVDTPFIDEEIVAKIVQEDRSDVDATIAKTAFVHPLIGIYHSSIVPLIEKEIAMHNFKLNAILQKSRTNYVIFEEEEKFLNLNYPHEFQHALAYPKEKESTRKSMDIKR